LTGTSASGHTVFLRRPYGLFSFAVWVGLMIPSIPAIITPFLLRYRDRGLSDIYTPRPDIYVRMPSPIKAKSRF